MNHLDRAAVDIHKAAPLMKRAAYASISVAALLILVKFAAGLYTDSVAILSSLVDSVLDLVASLVNYLAIRQAVQPADRQHRFGHGKAESLGSLVQGAIIFGSAAFLLFEAGTRVVTPQPVVHAPVGIAVMVFSILMTFALVAYQRRVIKRTGSTAVSADSLHYAGDLLLNLSVIAALLLATYGGIKHADPIFAVGIALYLIWNAVRIVRMSLGILMDRELEEGDRRKIKEMVMAHTGVLGMHDLRTRASGPQVFIQFHIELRNDISLVGAHEISDKIEDELMERYPGAEIIIHADPMGVVERRDEF